MKHGSRPFDRTGCRLSCSNVVRLLAFAHNEVVMVVEVHRHDRIADTNDMLVLFIAGWAMHHGRLPIHIAIGAPAVRLWIGSGSE